MGVPGDARIVRDVPVKPLVKAAVILSVTALGMGGLASCSSTATSSGHARRRPVYGGVVVVETVFGIGGIGQDSVEAIDQGNLPLIIGSYWPPRCS
jgi:hypothetical protein